MDENGNITEEDGKPQEINSTTILDLPRQVWLKLQNELDYGSYLNLRQSCKHFHSLIDTYLGHSVSFSGLDASEDCADVLEFFGNVAINDVQFGDCLYPDIFSFHKIIADPPCLRDVSFGGWTNLSFIRDIILNCHGLQTIEMTMQCKLYARGEEAPSFFKTILPGIDITSKYPPRQCHFRSVECLKLVPGVIRGQNLRSQLVMTILRATRAGPHLKRVIFQCELDEIITLSTVLRITCEVMEHHPNLEALFLALLNDEYLLPEVEALAYSHFMDIDSVQYFHDRVVRAGRSLKIKKMGLAMLNSNMQLIWCDFLKTQHHLVHLSLTVNIREGTFSKAIFDSFSASLEQLAIRGKFQVPFDFYHLSACTKLKEVCLHNLQETGGGGITPKCVNLGLVPEKLEGLILFQVVTRTEDIRQAVRNLKYLHTLVVFKCGHAAGETGVGLDCLKDILHKRSLNSTLMVQFICASTSEAEALAGVLYEMSQDADNDAGPIDRARTRFPPPTPRDQQHQDPHHDIRNEDIRLDEGQDNQVVFPAQSEGHSVPVVERPVSRGSHREEAATAPPNPDELFPPLVPQAPLPPQDEAQQQPDGDNPFNILHNILERVLLDGDDNPPARGEGGGVDVVGQLNDNLHFDNFHLNELDDDDVELIFDVGEQDIHGPMLDLFAAERLAREHNVQVGFILDGVIDIINEDMVRSKWLCAEDSNGSITYTLKISVEL